MTYCKLAGNMHWIREHHTVANDYSVNDYYIAELLSLSCVQVTGYDSPAEACMRLLLWFLQHHSSTVRSEKLEEHPCH